MWIFMCNGYKYIFPKYSDKTVKAKDCLRIKVAKEQSGKEIAEMDVIVSIISDFLKSIGMNKRDVLKYDLKQNPVKREFYYQIMKNYKLEDKRDIIWMKFTQAELGKSNGFLGVVASGNDINFSVHNSSGKIVKALGKKWDEEQVLIVPLCDIPHGWNRQRIESGIGNYLISKGIPILDYYSHNL